MAKPRRRISARKIAEAARGQSRVFFLAARRCNEFERLPSGRLRFLFVPTLVCYALCIELGLKALTLYEIGKAPRGHDLKKLFSTLPRALQARIVDDTGADAKRFESDLDLVRNVFEEWRYIYEKGHAVDTDLGFLQRLATAIQKVMTEFP